MAAYRGKQLTINAVQVNANTLNFIIQNYEGYTVSNGVLHDKNGSLISNDMWLVKLGDGSIKKFSNELFHTLFEPLTYKLSDLGGYDKGIRRKSWEENMHLKKAKWGFLLCEGDTEVEPYTFTEEDFLADDWVYADED